jgi:hypothetical protein
MSEQFARDDEAGFRVAVPRVLENIEILEIAGYVPGQPGGGVPGDGGYPCATVTFRMLDTGRAEYGTATIVYLDDSPSGPGWLTQKGDYGMTRDEARKDAARRIAHVYRL